MPFTTPILLLVFNRPEKTQAVFDRIKQIKPKYLYIAADGPRSNRTEDAALCEKTRNIVSAIDWECEVKKLFRNENLGCGAGPANAIDWFFNNVEEGIILEDDCIPDLSFFNYCAVLLDKYRNNSNIMHISGSNFQKTRVTAASYYFSNYVQVWGWATWKTAWSKFKYHVELDDSFDGILNKRFSNKSEINFWKTYIKHTLTHAKDVWDVQWVYAIFLNSGISINPVVNLISNIGYGSDATHTHSYSTAWSEKQTHSLTNIIHPKKIAVNKRADNYNYKKLYKTEQSKFKIIKFKIGQKLPWLKQLYLAAVKKQMVKK